MPVDVRNQLLAFYAELWTSEWGRGHMPFDVIETDVIDHLATLSAHRFGAGDAVAGARSFHG